MRRQIRLSKCSLGTEETQAVGQVFSEEMLGMGRWVGSFESDLSSFFGRPVVCVSTGTAALHLGLQGIGLRFGDEVLVQSLTFAASFQAIHATGAVAIACEVDQSTLTIDLEDAQKRMTARTKAIMPVHYAGGVGNLDAVYIFAKRHNLRVIEDASHAFGSTYQGLRVGSFGDVACFSFDGIKNITSGEGGCIVTNDSIVLNSARDARLLGVQKDTENRLAGQRSWDFEVSAQGWRYHMSNIMAAIGIEQLKKREVLAAKRKHLAAYYEKLLKPLTGIETITFDFAQVVPHIYPVKINATLRDEVRDLLKTDGIETGVHYKPCHLLSYFQQSGRMPLPNTERVYAQLLTLPLHPDLTESEIEFVCARIKVYLG